jgi:hypothetical protein
MIRHCVFIHFDESVRSADVTAMLDEIVALKNDLPGIVHVHIGANASPELGMDKGFSNGFIVDFDSAAARDRYLDDERHKKVGAKLVASAVGGAEGILVYDMEI